MIREVSIDNLKHLLMGMDKESLIDRLIEQMTINTRKNIQEMSDAAKADLIITNVCKILKIRKKDLPSPTKTDELSFTRYVCIKLIKEHSKLSHKKIGKIFGGRDHSTVSHAIKTFEWLVSTRDEKFDPYHECFMEVDRTMKVVDDSNYFIKCLLAK